MKKKKAARALGSSEAELLAEEKRIEEQVKDHDASMEVMAKSQQAWDVTGWTLSSKIAIATSSKIILSYYNMSIIYSSMICTYSQDAMS